MKKNELIGRAAEYRSLEKCYREKHAQLAIVMGRRRVGKTFLVNESFEDDMVFKVTGSKGASMKDQLDNFFDELRLRDPSFRETPKSWREAFVLLRQYLDSLPKDRRLVVFIDEMPWLDSRKSKFLPSFEYFWNHYGSAKKNLLLIVCGSASAWIQKKIIKNKGGLFNRQSAIVRLEPFTLSETEQYLESKGISWSRMDIARLYMVTGGVPFYLDEIDPELTLNENVDRLFFAKGAPLQGEFKLLYETLFDRKEGHVSVVTTLSKHRYGLTRKEIGEETKLPKNGNLSGILESLEQSGFIAPLLSRGERKEKRYYLSDFFTYFYLRFVQDRLGKDERFWSNAAMSQSRTSYEGIAFEFVCLSHISQIKEALGISGVLSEWFGWRVAPSEEQSGAQIDLVIDRRDNVSSLCEMKFVGQEFTISKDYDEELRNKIARYDAFSKHRKSIQMVFVSSYGLKRNMYSGLVQRSLTLDDLFR